jgi:hypothetical protein
MSNPYQVKAISPKLEKEIENMVLKIKELFKLDIGKIEASKIIAYKSKNSRLILDEKRLIKILGDNDESVKKS